MVVYFFAANICCLSFHEGTNRKEFRTAGTAMICRARWRQGTQLKGSTNTLYSLFSLSLARSGVEVLNSATVSSLYEKELVLCGLTVHGKLTTA